MQIPRTINCSIRPCIAYLEHCRAISSLYNSNFCFDRPCFIKSSSVNSCFICHFYFTLLTLISYPKISLSCESSRSNGFLSLSSLLFVLQAAHSLALRQSISIHFDRQIYCSLWHLLSS